MSRFLEGLNPKQQEAVRAIDGVIQVNAGAGSGKTRVLTHRLAYMIEQGIKPSNIMCTTFTKKATEEMIERMGKLIPKMTLAQVTIGTSHSIGYRILAKEYAAMNHRLAPAFKGRDGVLMNSKLRIFAEDIKKGMLADITLPMAVKKELNELPIPYFLKQISLAKNENITSDEFEQHLQDSSARSECVLEFYKRYEAKKWNERKIDPDDMLLLLVRLLQSNKKILDKYRKIYKYILVDEAQDNNGLQYEMFKLLAFPENNIFVVGDDDQSMYSFRGARPDQFINLKQIYSGVKTVALEDNYRSHPAVLSLANKLIVNNKVRLLKSLQAHKEDDGDDNTFFSLYKDEDAEAREVCKEIQALLQDGVKPKDVSILYRTNAQSRALEEGMIMTDIPYVIHGGVSFYDRKEIKDVLSYLKLLKDPTDDEAFVRVINVPSRYLGKVFLQKVLADGRSCLEVIRDKSFQNGLKPYEKRGVSSFLEVIDGMSDLLDKGGRLSEAVDYLLEGGYGDYLAEMGEDEADEDRLENVGTLKYVIDKKDDLSKFLEYVTEMTTGAKIDVNGVQLMTIHKSKGLEFPNVFIIGNNEGLLPHFKAVETSTKTGEDTAIEEERRLLYVAITRAESKVYLSSTKEYAGKDVKVSRFMGEIGKFKSNTSKPSAASSGIGEHSSPRPSFESIKREYYRKID